MFKFLFFCFYLFSALAQAGQEIGNGGDLVQCAPLDGSPFTGYYSLDYLLTYKLSNQNQDIVQVSSLPESLNRIRQNLKTKLPEFVESFDEFTHLLLNSNELLPRFWEEAPFGMVDLKDEQLVALVPSNCRKPDSLPIIQAIVRQHSSFSGTSENRIVYKYNSILYYQLETYDPLQLSFLLIHEWLWDISHNVDRNRRLNRFFHAIEFDQESKDEVREKLKALGVEIPPEAPPQDFHFDECPADPQFAKALESRIRLQNDVILATDFSGFVRQKECLADGFDTCPVSKQILFRDQRSPTDQRLVSAQASGEKMILRIENKDPNNYLSLTCSLDPATAQLSCDEMFGSFYTLSEKYAPRGRIGSNGCLRLYESHWDKTGTGLWQREILITSQLKNGN